MPRLLCVFIMLLLSACGFQLRGAVKLPDWFNNVALIADKNTDHALTQAMRARLEGYKINIQPDPAAARYWIIIEDALNKEQITAVSSTTIPRQYQMTYRVSYKVIQAKSGKVLLPSSLASTSRQLTINNNQILGSDNEETILKDEMRDEVVLQIINQLSLYLTRIAP